MPIFGKPMRCALWKQSFDRAQNAVDRFYTRVSEETLLDEPGMQPLRKKLLNDALDYYEQFLSEFSDRPELESKLVLAKFRVALITVQIESNNEALQMMLDLEASAKSVSFESEYEKSRFLAKLATETALLYDELGQMDLARAKHNQALHQLESLDMTVDTDVRGSATQCYHNLGWLNDRNGNSEMARQNYQLAIRLYKKILEQEPEHDVIQRALATTIGNEAILLMSLGETQNALENNNDVIARLEPLVKNDSDRNRLAANFANRGLIQRMAGKTSEALDSIRRSVEIRQAVADANPAVSRYQHNLAMSIFNYGMVLMEAGNFQDAEKYQQRSIEIYEKLILRNDENIEYQISLGAIHNQFARLLDQQGSDQAEVHFRNAAKRLENVVRRAEHRIARQQLADLYLMFGGSQIRKGNVEFAVELLRKIAGYSRIFGA